MESRTPAVEAEIARTITLARSTLDAYVEWGHQVEWSKEVSLATYADIIDFINFRLETAETCLQLVERGRIGDALGLCRSLLEYYLLFILVCRGDQYFRVWDLSAKTAEEFAEIFNEQKAAWEKERDAGGTNCVDFLKHPRAKRHIMLVYDGIVFDDGERLPVSMYFFHFDDFSPETMRLDSSDYFEYHEPDADLKKVQKGHRLEAQLKYRHFLSYGGLLMCLELNNLVDKQSRLRVEAHYTFLGKFLHPSKDAMRDLHERSNWHHGRPTIGMEYDYTRTSKLLASSYVCYLLAGILDEFANLFEKAPKKYVASGNTEELRKITATVEATMPYFWFIYNDAPPYDKFNWAVSHATDEQLKTYGGYIGLPTTLIPFNQHIYESLQNGLLGWSNGRVGQYVPPINV
jgi:hypothetical protein